MDLDVTASEFEENKETYKTGVANAAGVSNDDVELNVIATTEDSITVEAIITTDTSESAAVSNAISANDFAENMQNT